MNILLINHYAGSPDMGMEFRPYYMAREWMKAGHNVTIVAGDYSHLRINNPEVKRDFQEEIIDGIRYVWVKTGTYEGNGSARAFTMFRFVRKLKAHAAVIANERKPDAVIASSTYPLDTYAAQKIAKLAGAKLIHEVHDMWPATLYEIGGMPKSHPFVKAMALAEKSAYKHSDKVVSLLGGAKGYMVEHGMAPEKFVHIPNGIVEEEWIDPAPIPAEHTLLLDALHNEGKLIVGYFGGHALSNALDQLIDVATELASRDDIAFVLVGSGVEKPKLQERVKAEDLANVHFLPPVDKKSVPSLLRCFDCSYIGMRSSGLSKYGLSLNKLYDSMMGGKPVVFAVESVENPVAQYRCGVTVTPSDAREAAAAIIHLASLGQSGRDALGENGRQAAQENFTYELLSGKFLDAMR